MKKFLLFVFLVLFLPAFLFAQWKEGPEVNVGSYEASGISVIVTFEENAGLSAILDMEMPAGFALESLSSLTGINLPPEYFKDLKGFYGNDFSHGVVTFPMEIGLDQALAALSESKGVREVSPNYVLRPFYVPNDPYYDFYQGNFRQIYVDKAWNLSQGEGAVVAVIDSGYRQNGLEDRVKNLLNGYDFAEDDQGVQDYSGHGTHISNTIAQRTNNGIGCAGIAFKSTILPCKVFPDVGDGAYESDIIDAIYWAIDHGADVINMSLGGGGSVTATKEAIEFAVDNDVIVFAATGNYGVFGISYPARHESCIAVGAVNKHPVGANPKRADFSQYGTGLDIVAPGKSIVQETYSGSGTGYISYNGTSSACPHASAVAALLVSARGPDAILIREAMETTAYNPNGGWTDELGWGEINAYDAIYAYGGPSNDSPVAVATAFPSVGAPPLIVTFDASESYDPDGALTFYRWVKSTGVVLSHNRVFTTTFDKGDNFEVELTVKDNEGGMDSDSVKIEVDPDYKDDDCYRMLNILYEGCKLKVLDPEGIGMDDATALDSCREDSDGKFWTCLVECSDHEKVESCADFIACAADRCDITIKAAYSSKNDDDDYGFCGLCG